MTDIRRSILWVIFGFSMVLIWDQWQVHNGRPATFFPSAQPSAKAAQTAPTNSVPQASTPAGGAPGADASVPTSGANTIPRQTHTLATDLVKLVFDSEGGSLVGATLLQHAAVTGDKTKTDPLQLLLQTDKRTYMAQTGLIGGAFPTHKTPMRLVKQDPLSVRFESDAMGGVVLAKTYTLKADGYDIAVQHEVLNKGSTPVKPQVYLQLVRDGDKSESETPFYSTFTGPAFLFGSPEVPKGGV